MNVKPQRLWRIIKWGALPALVLFVYFCIWWLHRVSVYGEVVDEQTGQPIADAYVIATFWTSLLRNPFDSNPHKFAVHTDETGHFSFRAYPRTLAALRATMAN